MPGLAGDGMSCLSSMALTSERSPLVNIRVVFYEIPLRISEISAFLGSLISALVIFGSSEFSGSFI